MEDINCILIMRVKQSTDWIGEIWMKRKLYKLFLVLIVSLSLGSNPIAQNEILKMLESLSGAIETNVQESDEDEKEPEEIKDYEEAFFRK